jgi:TPR repeat protein
LVFDNNAQQELFPVLIDSLFFSRLNQKYNSDFHILTMSFFMFSCYTLAAMLLRGDKVNKTADNVSPQEARGVEPVAKRENEEDRTRGPDEPYVITRDPKRAEQLLKQACDTGSHVTSCHNLAVMYTHGDDGVPAHVEQSEEYKRKTQEKIHLFGGFEPNGN